MPDRDDQAIVSIAIVAIRIRIGTIVESTAEPIHRTERSAGRRPDSPAPHPGVQGLLDQRSGQTMRYAATTVAWSRDGSRTVS